MFFIWPAAHLMVNMLSLAIFLVNGYAFYKLATLRGLPNAWFAFVPFFGLYMTGMIGDSMKYNHYKINQYIRDIPLAFAMPIAALSTNILVYVPLIGPIAVWAINVLLWAAGVMIYYFTFSMYAERNMVIPFTLLSIIPIVGPCLILYCLKDRRMY